MSTRIPLPHLALCFLLAVAGCKSVQERETSQGTVITVRAGTDTIPGARALVCHPKEISRRGTGSNYSVFVHVKRLDGDRCAWVTFKCSSSGAEGAEVKVCIGDPPVNTGCKTSDGKDVLIEVTDVFK